MPATLSNPIPEADGRTTRGSVPLYVAGFLVTLSALLSIGLLLDEDPGFVSMITLITAVGFVVSFLVRRQSVNAYSVELPAAAVCVLLAIAATTDRGIPFLAPAGLEGDRAKGLAVMLIWITVFRSFTLITDGSVLFSCVLSIAIMGLVGTMTSDPALTRYFALFIVCAAFMMVHECFLSARRRQSGTKRPRQSKLFLGQIQAAILCAAGACLLAIPAAVPLQAVGSLLAFSPGSSSTSSKSSTTQNPSRINIVEQPAVSVGTGPVSLSDEPVMRIKASQGSYWRGASFNVYNGRGWSSSLEQSSILTEDMTGRTVDEAFNDPIPGAKTFTIAPNEFTSVGPRSHEVTQHVSFVGNGWFMDIYAAPEIRSLTMSQDRAQTDPSGGVHLYQVVQGFQYTVKSQVADTSPTVLQAAGDDYPSVISQNFQGILDSANPSALNRLRETAEEVTRGKTNAYDKVLALKEWVESQCKYNTGTPAYPLDVDVAEHFLFTAKQGYCDSFATALAMLCRAAGIPARVASGFAPGTFEAESQEYVVKERDKHLWTEVYFPNVGWVTFDATEGAEDVSERGDTRKDNKGTLLGVLFSRGPLPPIALLIMIAMIAFVIKVELWDRFRPRHTALEQLGLPTTNIAVIQAYDAACKSLARLGRPRLPSITPGEYLDEMRSVLFEHPDAHRALESLTVLAVRFRYSALTAADPDVALATDQLKALRAALRPIRRNSLTVPHPIAEPA